MRTIKQSANELVKFLWSREYQFEPVLMSADEETTNFKKWKADYVSVSEGTMKILADFCQNTIFDFANLSPYCMKKGDKFNILSRLWHDEYHYNLDLDFSLKSELKVQWGQFTELKASGVSNEALILFALDMVGQSEYYGFYKKFLNNQKEMVRKWYEIYLVAYGNEIPKNWEEFCNIIADLVKFVGVEK